jgi:hypothetical protein
VTIPTQAPTAFTPKLISRAGVPTALEKAQRYRLLNEPEAAESICLDVLAVDAGNQQARILLLLAVTDQFDEELTTGLRRARELLSGIDDEYRRRYYAGIICERYAMAKLRQGAPHAAETAYEWLRNAMEAFEQAEAMRPDGNDEAVLRWNTCARVLARNRSLAPGAPEAYEPSLE